MDTFQRTNPYILLVVTLVLLTVIKLLVPELGSEIPFFLYTFGLFLISLKGERYSYIYIALSVILIETLFQEADAPTRMLRYLVFIIFGVFITKLTKKNLDLIQKLDTNAKELENANKKLKVQNDRIIELMDQALDYSPNRKRSLKKK